jgi:hypothetical protein
MRPHSLLVSVDGPCLSITGLMSRATKIRATSDEGSAVMDATSGRLRRRQSKRHRSASSMICGLLILLGMIVGGCASSSSAASPQARCTVRIAPTGVDVVQTALQCTVTNAPQSDTRFTLHYALLDDAGKPQPPFDATCEGALAHGTGTCQQTYSVVAPKSPTDSSVSGESSPSHTALGPVTPTEANS